MEKASLKSIAEKLKDIDFCMMTTIDDQGRMHACPMSNNRQVEYDGDSWFFSSDDTKHVRQIENNANVSLSFNSKNKLFIECSGQGSIIKEKSQLEEHWVDDLEMWFPEGVDTPGLCLIKVTADRVHFWEDGEEGEYQA